MTTTPLRFATKINVRVLPEWTAPDSRFEYIDIGSVGSDGSIRRPHEMIAFADAPSRARRLAPPGSTIVSTVRTYLRAIAYVDADLASNAVFSTGFAVLEPAPWLNDRFFHYACRSEPFVDEVVARSVGVSYPAIAPSELGSLEIPSPSLAVQQRIADFLDDQVARIDEIIHLREEQAGAVQESVDHRIAEVVEEAASRWGWTTMRRIMRGIEQGWSPQCESRSAAAGEFGVLRLGAIRSGAFRELENKALPSGVEPAWSYQVMPGDLLISRANTPLLVGDVAVVPSTVPGNLFLPDLLYRVRLGIGEGEFVSAGLRTPRVRGLVRVIARGTSQSMVKLRGEDIADLPIPAAPADVRAGIADQSVRGRSLALSMRKEMTAQIELLQERKRSLITAAVTGEFDVSTASGRGVA